MTTHPSEKKSRFDPEPMPRRDFLGLAALGSMAAAFALSIFGMLKLPKAAVSASPAKKFNVALPDTLPEGEVDFLEMVGRQRGCLGSGGHVDFHKISNILLQELRNIVIGRVTMETPEMIEQELVIVEQKRAEKAAKEAAKKKKPLGDQPRHRD